jgi:hypothetical protein
MGGVKANYFVFSKIVFECINIDRSICRYISDSLNGKVEAKTKAEVVLLSSWYDFHYFIS